MAELGVGGPRRHIPEGLVDCGHHYPRCSNCQAILMDIFVTAPCEFTWKIKANCPFCDENEKTKGLGGSDPIEVQGRIHFGGYGRMISEDEDIPSTCVDSWDINEGAFEFKIKKASEDARPLYT